jgi:hypothetical protein
VARRVLATGVDATIAVVDVGNERVAAATAGTW